MPGQQIQQQHQRQQMFYQDQECQGFNQQSHYGGGQQGGYYQPHQGQPPQQQSRSDFYRTGGKGFRGSNNSLASSSDGGYGFSAGMGHSGGLTRLEMNKGGLGKNPYAE